MYRSTSMHRDPNQPVVDVDMKPVIAFLLRELPELFKGAKYPENKAEYLAGKLLTQAVGISPRGHNKPGGGIIDIAWVFRDALWKGHLEDAGFDLVAAEEKSLLLARKLRIVLTGGPSDA